MWCRRLILASFMFFCDARMITLFFGKSASFTHPLSFSLPKNAAHTKQALSLEICFLQPQLISGWKYAT